MANKNWTKTTIKLSDSYSASERRAIAQDFVDYIVDRTRKGHGKGDKPWKGKAGEYSKSYRDSFEFKSKTSKGKVTLELFGDMLSSIEKLSSGASEVAVGIKQGDEDYSKAEGNIRGTYGQKTPIKGKARPFMDLSKGEITKILKPYKSKKTTEERVAAFKAAALLAKELSGS